MEDGEISGRDRCLAKKDLSTKKTGRETKKESLVDEALCSVRDQVEGGSREEKTRKGKNNDSRRVKKRESQGVDHGEDELTVRGGRRSFFWRRRSNRRMTWN